MKKKAKKKSRKGRKTSPIPKSTTLPPEQLEKIIDFLKNTDKTFQQINKEMGFGVNDKTVSRINYEMNIRSQEEVRALAKNPKRVIPEKKRALIRGFLWSSRMTYAQIAKRMKVPPAWIYEVKKEDMPGLKRVYRKHDFIGAFSEKEKAKMVEENIGLLRVAVTDIIDVRYGPFFDQMLEEAKSGFLNALDYYNPKHPGKAKPAYFAIAGAKWAVLNYLGKESITRRPRRRGWWRKGERDFHISWQPSGQGRP